MNLTDYPTPQLDEFKGHWTISRRRTKQATFAAEAFKRLAQLERQLAETRKLADDAVTTSRALKEKYGIGDRHVMREKNAEIETLKRQLAEARLQRDDAQGELAEWKTLQSWGGTPEIINDFIKGQQTRIHAAQHAEEQRDRLAEAAAKIRLFVIESKESADYWFSVSECQCVSPQPIGSCLACYMAGISLCAEEALATLDRKEDA